MDREKSENDKYIPVYISDSLRENCITYMGQFSRKLRFAIYIKCYKIYLRLNHYNQGCRRPARGLAWGRPAWLPGLIGRPVRPINDKLFGVQLIDTHANVILPPLCRSTILLHGPSSLNTPLPSTRHLRPCPNPDLREYVYFQEPSWSRSVNDGIYFPNGWKHHLC